jgi:predicted metal-dependent enzyme (double-stranded beta helix superfamily)
MKNFTIDGFAEGCKEAMSQTENKHRAARKFLENTLAESDTESIIEKLEAELSEGASIGEMIVHCSPELTMLYGRIPPRFQSGIHNHTLFACIGQLEGEEVNVFYRKTDDNEGLQETARKSIKAGEVLSLAVDAIHRIENPNQTTGKALHIYGGDFGAVMERRSLWTYGEHREIPFSFEILLQESAKTMKGEQNEDGLNELAQAIPATKPLVESLLAS